MKIIARSVSLVLVSALSIGLLVAQSCPKPVKDAFNKAYPNAKAKWMTEKAKDKTMRYEADFKQNGVEMTTTYNALGTLMETGQEIEKSEVPAAVIAACLKAHPDAKIKEYSKITRANNEVVYEVEMKNNGHAHNAIFKSNGVMESN